jgi:hypothetical protein
LWAAAAEATVGPDSSLIVAVGGLLGVVVTTVGAIIVQAIKSRSERTTVSPPAPEAPGAAERLAVLEYRAREGQQRDDDSDVRDDMQDRAIYRHDTDIEALKRWADRTDPGWRR